MGGALWGQCVIASPASIGRAVPGPREVLAEPPVVATVPTTGPWPDKASARDVSILLDEGRPFRYGGCGCGMAHSDDYHSVKDLMEIFAARNDKSQVIRG